MKQAARRIFEILSDLEMSDYEFATEYGFSRSTVNNWRNEDVDPGADMIQKFCDGFGITLKDFYGGGVFAEGKENKKDRQRLIINILKNMVLKKGFDDELTEFMKFLLRDTKFVAM